MKSTRLFRITALAGLVGLTACKDVLKVVEIASIQIAGYSGPLEEGTSVQLTATPKDDRGTTLVERPIAWKSSNNGVATVSSSGLVIAVSQGSATIEASAEGKTSTVTVVVTVPSVATVTIAPGASSIEVGKTVQLMPTLRDSRGLVLTGRAVEWTSSNLAVATVSATGLVRGEGQGTATIRASSEGVQGTATVEVTSVPVASVTIEPASGQIDVGYTLQLTATPRDPQGNPLTGRDIAWSSSETSVATVDQNGLVTGRGNGNAIIQAESEGKFASITVRVIVPMAWVYANFQTTPSYVPAVGLNLTGGAMTVTRTAVGRYTVVFESLGKGESGTSFTAHVTTNSANGLSLLTAPSGICGIIDMNVAAPVTVQVQCIDPVLGFDADYRFRLLVVADRVLGGAGSPGQRAAFSLHNITSATSPYTPNPNFSWNSAGAAMTVAPGASNSQVHNHGEVLNTPFAMFTTRLGPSTGVVCPVTGFTSQMVTVGCRDRTGTIVNNGHLLLALQQGRPGTEWGYAFFNASNGAWDPAFSATSGTGISVIKNGVGKYTVAFEGTNISTTPAILLSTTDGWLNCTHFYTNDSPVTIEVACSNAAGLFVDDPNGVFVAFMQ